MIALTTIGIVLLAVGALLGWPMALHSLDPTALKTYFFVKNVRRLLQMHIDYVLMGLILVAVGLAVPTLPEWNRVVLLIGTIVNPLLFAPLAFKAEIEQWWSYRVISVASFLCVSVGMVGAAYEALTV